MTEISSDQAIRWTYLPGLKRFSGLVLFAIAIAMIVKAPHPQSRVIRGIIGGLVGLGLYQSFKGGGSVEPQLRHIVRWRGPFFPVVKKTISFGEVQRIVVSRGMSAFEPGTHMESRLRFANVALDVHGTMTVLRVLNQVEEANQFADQLSVIIGAPAFHVS